MSEANKSDWQRLAAAALVAALVIAGAYAIFFVAPTESRQREIQRIFYLHVGSAWSAGVAFLVTFIANIAFLPRRNMKWDRIAVSSAEVGLAFCTVVLITGPIWAKPVWGVAWVWDARLTTTAVLWLLYVSYLLLRSFIADPARRAVASAAFGIFAFLDVPLVYFSIRIWRTQHPSPVIAGGEGSGLDPVMWNVFLFNWVALLGVMVLLIWKRYRVEALRHEIEELEVELDWQAREGQRQPVAAEP
jgi:heme exporter protein C